MKQQYIPLFFFYSDCDFKESFSETFSSPGSRGKKLNHYPPYKNKCFQEITNEYTRLKSFVTIKKDIYSLTLGE